MYCTLSEMGMVCMVKSASYVKRALEYIFHRYKREQHEKKMYLLFQDQKLEALRCYHVA